MKALDTIITIAEYENSSVNKGGKFIPPLGILKDFGIDKDAITVADLEKLFKVYWHSAYDDINAFNPDRPLNVIQYIDLQNNAADDTIRDAIILQVNELLKNGLVETKNSNQNSTSAFTSNISPNTRIISPDQLSQDVEDKLGDIKYKDWAVVYAADGTITVTLDGVSLLAAKTMNHIALSSLVYEGLDDSDITFIGKNRIIKLINDTTASARAFQGTWDAADRATASDIDNEFTTNGLPLTDGVTTLTPANTDPGDTILLTITSDASFPAEELVFDGVNWVLITNNDQEDVDIAAMKARLDAIELKIPELETKLDAHITSTAAQFVAVEDRLLVVEKDDIKQTAELTDHEQRITENTAGVSAYLDERADYVRVEDLPGNLLEEFVFPDPKPVATLSGNDIEFTFTALTTITDGNVATWKLIDNGSGDDAPTIELRDSHNDGSRTAAIINVNGNDQDVTIQGMNDKIDIQGLNAASRNYLIANYVLDRVEQIKGSATRNIDTVARAAALAADTKAQAAAADAATKVSKQLVQGAQGQYNSFAELKTIINDDEFVALTLATGMKVTGRVTDDGNANAADPIVITGFSIYNSNVVFGTISINDQFITTVTSTTDGKYIPLPNVSTQKELFDSTVQDTLYELTDPFNNLSKGLFTVYNETLTTKVVLGVIRDGNSAREVMTTVSSTDNNPFIMQTVNLETGEPLKGTHAINLNYFQGHTFLKTDYEEKEITITPAVYGWKNVDIDEINNSLNVGKRWLIFADSGSGVLAGISSKIYTHGGYHFTISSTSSDKDNWTYSYTSYKPDKLTKYKFDGTISSEVGISKVSVWDIITPAVKATVLVKK